MDPVIVPEQSIKEKRIYAASKLNGKRWQIAEKFKGSDILPVLVEFVALYEAVNQTLSLRINGATGSRFVNTYSAFIASEIGLEELLSQDHDQEANGNNRFNEMKLDFSGPCEASESKIMGALDDQLKYVQQRPLSNLLFDFFTWVNNSSLSEADRPELDIFVKGAYNSTVTVQSKPQRVYSGFDKQSSLKPSTEKLTWADFGGYEDIKKELCRFTYHFNQPNEYYVENGPLKNLVPKGFLFVGPPGTGKTYLAKVFANECKLDFKMFDHASLGSKYINQTSNNLRRRIEEASAAVKKGYKRGVFIFIDEIDAGTMSRGEENHEDSKTVEALNDVMNGIFETDGVIFGGASNRPELMDVALIRPGRFSTVINMGIPRDDTLSLIYKIYIDKLNGSRKDKRAFDKDIKINELVALSSNEKYLDNLKPDMRILVETGVISGSRLDEYNEAAQLLSKGKIGPLLYHSLTTPVAIMWLLTELYSVKLYESGLASKPYQPITTSETKQWIKEKLGRI